MGRLWTHQQWVARAAPFVICTYLGGATMAVQIPLTKGKVALVDEEDYERLTKYSWRLKQSAGGNLYAQRDAHDGSLIVMHREVLKPPPDKQVDHINGDGLDNRRSNLRVCSPGQNQANAEGWSGTSEYRGVRWRESKGKWVAEIKIDGKSHHIGYFDDEVEAARAYDRRAMEEWGEFYTPQVLTTEKEA